MVNWYDAHRLRVAYPENWTLEEEEDGSRLSASFQSPSTAFILLTIHDDFPQPDELVKSVLETMREEYEGVESEEVKTRIADTEAIGWFSRSTATKNPLGSAL